MEYFVVSNTDWIEFLEKVNYLLLQGWEPCGGVAVTMSENGSGEYYQAVTRVPRSE